ncbi:MAG: NYN domain-containing protein, partial [Chloroflexota bacterium]
MGNLCIFVDAGYLFKQGSSAALHAKLGRHDLLFNALDFMAALRAWLRECYPEDELLRTYWYDGAKQGVPSPDQLDVASLAFVKLRLGRINSAGQQKGVDTLMVRDLMVLSQERSIHRAVVLSGDEDLREGIEYAQDRGVRVALVGIDAAGDRSQSVELVRESDENLLLPQNILDGMLERRTPPRRKPAKGQADLPSGPAEGVLASAGNALGSFHVAPVASPASPGSDQPLGSAAAEGLATAKRPTARRSRGRRAGAEAPATAVPPATALPLLTEESVPLAEAEETQQPWGDVRP